MKIRVKKNIGDESESVIANKNESEENVCSTYIDVTLRPR
jgi:hypothetical protein